MDESLLKGAMHLRYALVLFLALTCSLTYAQKSQITGTVQDEQSGDVLPGVNVLIKGTAQGTVTDSDGKYTIAADENETLVFSFVGYANKEIIVAGQTVINVSLLLDITSLEEIVVIGYGEQKKSLTTGAISSIKSDELKTVSFSRVDQALQGRTAGVNITPNSGSPGAGTKIRIRGTSSNGNSDPLYIIDGVRTGAGGMDYLSPNEIASIEVLKDAASAAIYGAEGANGVIIITTKKGKADVSEISYSAQFGQQSVSPDLMKMMSASQYQQYLQEAGTPGAPTAADVTDPNGTNWFDELFASAPMQNHALTLSGGTDRLSYFLGGTYYTQEGVAGGDKSRFKRYTLRLNTSYKIREWLTVGENFSYTNLNRRGISEDTEFGSLVGSALALDPLTPVIYTNNNYPPHFITAFNGTTPGGTPIGPLLATDKDGNYYGISNWVKGEFGNPLARVDLERGETIQNKVLGNVYAEITPASGLKFTTRFGLDAAFQRLHDWSPTFWFSSESLNTIATGNDTWEQWFTWQWENFATYDKFIGDHHFTLLAGGSMQKYTYNNLNGRYSGLFREEDKWSYADYVPDTEDRIGGRPEYRSLASFFGRLSYDYKGKYLFNATVRRDGSSMLAEGNQWGVFPSVSAGWIITGEDFFPENVTKVVSHLKLRASWGQNGSLGALSPGQWQAAISTDVGGVIRYPGSDGTYLEGAAPTNLPNPDLTWETSEQFDIGADFRFFNDRLTLTVDYFNKKTKDLITPGSPPLFAGNSLPFFNGGNVENKGFEFEIGYNSNSSKAFQYGISANLTTIDNVVTYLDPNVPNINGVNVGTSWSGATQFKKGYPIWYFNGYKTDGIFQNQAQIDAYLADGLTGYSPQPGDPIIVNTNGDNQISPADQTYIGSPFPDFYFGTRLNMSYKGFDFLVFVQGQIGNDILMGFNRTDRATANKPAFFYEDRWTGEGSTNSWFRPNTSGTFVYSSDFMIFDGSYARVRQMQLGYTLPNSLGEKLKVRNARFYVSLDNFFTFTNYPGMDPEAGSGNDRSQGIDRGVYPVPRTVLGGFSLTF